MSAAQGRDLAGAGGAAFGVGHWWSQSAACSSGLQLRAGWVHQGNTQVRSRRATGSLIRSGIS